MTLNANMDVNNKIVFILSDVNYSKMLIVKPNTCSM